MKQPKPTDNEIKLSDTRYIVSKTDAKGVITYANDYFVEICGYSEEELLGQPHNIVRHPDMPKVAFKLMWDRIKQGKNFIAVVKNLAKDGSYYWVVTDFEPKIDPITNEVSAHTAFRKAAPRKAIDVMSPIYATLLKIEQEDSVEASEMFLRNFLEENRTTYDEFINKTIGNSGMFKIFFKAMKKIFS
ncbi:MAG: PAS domain-containing protein [Campylobacterota bacterium]